MKTHIKSLVKAAYEEVKEWQNRVDAYEQILRNARRKRDVATQTWLVIVNEANTLTPLIGVINGDPE